MAVLVVAEHDNSALKDATHKLVTAAAAMSGDVDVLVDRVGRKGTRPLLKSGNPREILTRLKAEREPAYAQAPIRVLSSAGPQARTVALVLKGIAEWL